MRNVRRCIFHGCQSSPVSLFKFPTNEELRKRWIDFVKRHQDPAVGKDQGPGGAGEGGAELKISTNTRLCNEHFTPDSFLNYHRRQLGYTDKPLLLAKGAAPTVFLPASHPPSGTGGATSVSRTTCPTKTRAPPTTRDAACRSDDMHKVTREVGCQTDLIGFVVRKRTVDALLKHQELSKIITQSNRENTGFQATEASSSTSLKQNVVPSDGPPTKRPHLEFPSPEDSETSSHFSYPDNSTCLPGTSEMNDTSTTTQQAPTKTPQDMAKYLVYEDCLLDLFKVCPKCSGACKVHTFVKGTFLSVTQVCLHQSCSYTRKWISQPLLGSTPAGNLHLSAAVYYTGSSFVQTNKVLNAMHVRTINGMAHRKHVHSYILPSVLHKWRSQQTDLLEGLKLRETVSLGGDMRADSPHHCKMYTSYSMMDLNTNKIVHIQLVQSNEGGSDVCMEKEGLIRSLEFLERSDVKVASLVTDRQTQVQNFLQEQKPDIDHYYDVWLLCKALNKEVDAISKEKGCQKVNLWKQSITNHLYWSASSSSSGEETVAKWTSLLKHIQNVHVHDNPLFPTCLHPPSTVNNKWLKPATKAICKLERVLMNKRVLGDVKKLSPVCQASALEGFHNVIQRLAPKNVICSYLGMLCRLYLAALHFNENSWRTQARTKAEQQLKIEIPMAKRGEYVVSMDNKTNCTTDYVTELTDLLFNEVIHDPAPFAAEMILDPGCSRSAVPPSGPREVKDAVSC